MKKDCTALIFKENNRNNHFTINIKIKTNTKYSTILKEEDGIFHIAISALPDKEKANKELIKYLSKLFNCSKESISIIRGVHSSLKTVKVDLDLPYNEIYKILLSVTTST